MCISTLYPNLRSGDPKQGNGLTPFGLKYPPRSCLVLLSSSLEGGGSWPATCRLPRAHRRPSSPGSTRPPHRSRPPRWTHQTLDTSLSLSFPAVPLTQRPAMVDGGLAAAGGGSWLARFTARRPRPLTSRPANVSLSLLCFWRFHWLLFTRALSALSHHVPQMGQFAAFVRPWFYFHCMRALCRLHPTKTARLPTSASSPALPFTYCRYSLPHSVLYIRRLLVKRSLSLFSVHIQNLTTF
jgi:hypothetical protein